MLIKMLDTEYFAIDAWSASKFKVLHKKSDRHLLLESESSKSMNFGSAFHKYILEPNLFELEYYVMPSVMPNGEKVDRRYKEGKLFAEKHEKLAEGKTVISMNDFEKILMMERSIKEFNNYKVYFNANAQSELTCTNTVEEIPCKIKMDLFTSSFGQPTILDLKSCQSAERSDFIRDCYKYGYYLQAAHYKKVLEKELGENVRFVFLAVESEAPYSACWYEVDEEGEHFQKALVDWQWCRSRALFFDKENPEPYMASKGLELI